LEDFAAKLSEGLDKLDRDGQRDIIRAFVKRIDVDSGGIEIIFRVPPSNAPVGPGSFPQSSTDVATMYSGSSNGRSRGSAETVA
jgi:site-specific DNA recombinase